ncbi:MAG: GDYXXLXY domain-containing protein [Candidatus Riflebacteria bacterium]|nr:GDYXXLXY domain-containing protein [Candidatus Riflebacteria bacterium]
MAEHRKALFFGGLALQLVILLLVPLPKLTARLTGTPVILKVVPVDPYSIMSGYYMTLGFEISQTGRFPPGTDARFSNGETVYAVVKPGPEGCARPLFLARKKPDTLADGEVAIKGRMEHGSRVVYGIERFYIPEARRHEIDKAMREKPDANRVEILVGPDGTAILQRLLTDTEVFE